MRLYRKLDWVIKKHLIDSYIGRKGCDFRDARVGMMGLQYHDIDQTKGLYYTMQRAGHIDRLIDDDAVAAAQQTPPDDTRAYFRGACLSKFPKQIYAVSWTSVIFDLGADGMKRVPLMDPRRGSRSLIGPVLVESQTAEALLAKIAPPE